MTEPGTKIEYIVQERRRTAEMIEAFGEWRSEYVSESQEESDRVRVRWQEATPEATFRVVRRTTTVTEDVITEEVVS